MPKPPLADEPPAPTAPQERLDDATLLDEGDELTDPVLPRPLPGRPTRPDRPRLDEPHPK